SPKMNGSTPYFDHTGHDCATSTQKSDTSSAMTASAPSRVLPRKSPSMSRDLTDPRSPMPMAARDAGTMASATRTVPPQADWRPPNDREGAQTPPGERREPRRRRAEINEGSVAGPDHLAVVLDLLEIGDRRLRCARGQGRVAEPRHRRLAAGQVV